MSENVLLICTVGGTPEAVAVAIKGAKPQRIVFIVSPETRGDVETGILPLLQRDGITINAGQFDYLQIPDAQDFTGCVERIRELVDEASRWRARGEDFTVLVDFTGGTKCMSASLALVARQWRCRFSYVGGSERNKDGKGVVVSGSERILHYRNPWDALGYQVVEDAAILFDRGNYEAAVQILDRALPEIERLDVKRELVTFKCLSQTYLEWDRFNHKKADERFEDVEKNGNDLRYLFPGRGDESLQVIRQHRQFLAQFRNGMVGRHVLLDLCANARRCADRGRYDDAVARLYRTIEAAAQFQLHSRHCMYHCNENGAPDFGKLLFDRMPEPLRGVWVNRRRADGTVALALQDDFALLSALKDSLAERFSVLEGKESPLSARNQSILAHGFIPVGGKVFNDLWRKTLALADIKENELPVFPRLGSSEPKSGESGAK